MIYFVYLTGEVFLKFSSQIADKSLEEIAWQRYPNVGSHFEQRWQISVRTRTAGEHSHGHGGE